MSRPEPVSVSDPTAASKTALANWCRTEQLRMIVTILAIQPLVTIKSACAEPLREVRQKCTVENEDDTSTESESLEK